MSIIDEKRKAESILRTGDMGTKIMSTCALLCKYWFGLGKNKMQVRSEIESFMKENYKGFNSVKWMNRLDSLVASASKRNNHMIYVDKIIITEPEMQKIESLKSKPLKRLAFVILYHAKLTKLMYGKDEVWLTNNVGRYSKIAKVFASSDNKMLMMSKLKDFGLIKISNSLKHFTYRVDFLLEGEEAIVINNVVVDNDIIMYYREYLGMKTINCVDCGCLVEKTNNKIKYCKVCSKRNKNAQDVARKALKRAEERANDRK